MRLRALGSTAVLSRELARQAAEAGHEVTRAILTGQRRV
ncbi:hypothetical protein N802_12370 [Knoellia sinensis KCTC 19936]|uniref:Uncharacterized protein n=1 Tax=Knoellia sinensis KCTC 19936 TaxID=1385520 RepID=A0A0A0JEA3_9MICO|nr:hypothetical protein N802_12370 [Knoellia sinensis KCTC 19936]